MMNNGFWEGKRVFITGITGFKGAWLALYLSSLGAKVSGYSLTPPSTLNLFEIAEVSRDCGVHIGDINDLSHLTETMDQHRPQIVFHLAAQPIVRKSYLDPVNTFKTNVLGTVHVLEAARQTPSVRVVVNVTSDKCYENTGEIPRPFVEEDRMGGHDPYSASKGCAELVAESYRKSYQGSLRIASVRAGNVIGGGDWAEDRLLPDMVRAIMNSSKLEIRNPHSTRPWQHVMEPLDGYIRVAERLWDCPSYDGGWNFGPSGDEHITVSDIIDLTTRIWDTHIDVVYIAEDQPYEAKMLMLDSSKSIQQLEWRPRLSTEEAVEWTIEWYRRYALGENMREFTLSQIAIFNQKRGRVDVE